MPELLRDSIQSFLDYLKYQRDIPHIPFALSLMRPCPVFGFLQSQFGEVSLGEMAGTITFEVELASIRERDTYRENDKYVRYRH